MPSSLSNLRIFVVGEYSPRPAEGMQVITHHLIKGFQDLGCQVNWSAGGKALLFKLPMLLSWRPSVVVFTHGPGPGVLFFSGLIHRFSRATLIWLSPQPNIKNCPQSLLKFAHVDHVLSSLNNRDVARVVESSDGKYSSVIHGVNFKQYFNNQKKWQPAERKSVFDLPDDRRVPVLLHVGHVKKNRGLEKIIDLKAMIGDQAEVVVIGSPKFPPDNEIVEQLHSAGVVLRMGYAGNLADSYRAADAYLFPTSPEVRGAVDVPLSVLEALACGTPVISTPYGGLPSLFSNKRGVFFIDSEKFSAECKRLIDTKQYSMDDPIGLDEEFDVAALPKKLLSAINEYEKP